MGSEDENCLADLLKTHKTTQALLAEFKAQCLAQISCAIANLIGDAHGRKRTSIYRAYYSKHGDQKNQLG